MIETQLKAVIRDIPDFPKPGILFKDITPVLKDADLCNAVIDAFVERLRSIEVDVVAGIESRGFLFGLLLANRLGLPFIPIRKKGKLPYATVRQAYSLEYGEAVIEMHLDAFPEGTKVLLHDDLLATGGTAHAATELIAQLGGSIAAYTFVVALDFLNGSERLQAYHDQVITLVRY